ncbi:MAG TPA: hypothetical protein VF120_03890, partial [Ktedonobacterales bacterium]
MARTTETATAPAPPATPPRRRRSKRPAAIIALLWFTVVTVSALILGSVAAAVLSRLRKQTFPLVGHLWQHGAPLVRIGMISVGAVIVAILAAALLFLFRAYHSGSEDAPSSVESGPPDSELLAGMETRLSERIEALAPQLRQESPPITPAANVRAPNGFPLARPFVGRRDQL